ncbi:unnamed protein product [Leptidea sinapis]|uniref:C2H2-type domain-containing protein n=1 Tax=Leptidea sinapis TaxID=189913 RepID=A0A5E4QN06_9NEOP|nr:unnamed protein product [Leptidea sinapis]
MDIEEIIIKPEINVLGNEAEISQDDINQETVEQNLQDFRNKDMVDKVYANDVAPVLCPQCGKKCNGKRKLKLHVFTDKILHHRHMKATHPPVEHAESCDVCNKTFKSSLHVKVHKTAVHATENLPCDICDRTFSSKKYLLRHKVTHSDLKIECKVCLKYYKSDACLKRHLTFNIIYDHPTVLAYLVCDPLFK